MKQMMAFALSLLFALSALSVPQQTAGQMSVACTQAADEAEKSQNERIKTPRQPVVATGDARTNSGQAGEEVQLPVLMYHSILNSRKGVYVISERQLRDDLRALRRAGYSFVRASEVIAYAEGRGNLPEKPVLITFDDGHYNTYHYALPILREMNASAVFNVVGKYTDSCSGKGEKDNPNYSYLTWEEIGEMAQMPEAEIGNHTYAMHEYHPRFGVERIRGETDAAYKAALQKDICGMQQTLKEKSGVVPQVFAYPFGKYNKTAEQIILGMGFKMILTCTEGVSTVRQGDPTSLYALKRFNRNGAMSTAFILQEVTQARSIPFK